MNMAVKTDKKPTPSMTKKAIAEAFDRFAKTMPEAATELHFTNPYTLLVAVALSAQATDVGVNKATKSLFEIVKTPADMLALGLDGLIGHIKTIGLYNSKAKNLIAMAEILISDHDGIVPEDRDALEALPGVGRKTANVVLNEAFGHPTIAVDTHIFRLGNRTGMAPGKTPLEVEKNLLKRVPEHALKEAHHWLILHGRYCCVARKPRCSDCIIKDLCRFKDKTPD
ncbi:MAG: endonuclease III [Candidatus Puniceispirillum sp. TMED52]|nr:endonuclease III [SAR116 cluster bacterium]OUU48195.1 MAG: endonuclease III [Candidatus Puniceispirillum sp. TMED52]